MIIESSSIGKEKVTFRDPSEAYRFATMGIPGRHSIKSATLALRALVSKPERRLPLSVTLPTSSMMQGGEMLSDEATRLEGVLNSNTNPADKEIGANPESITAIRELSIVIRQHLGETAVSVQLFSI